MPCFSAETIKKASRMAAVELIVMDIEILFRGMPFVRISISESVQIGTPTLPISPSAIEWSESYPVWVGRSKATDSPMTP
jgi:hypothetical protein